jgi:hypothetical protein
MTDFPHSALEEYKTQASLLLKHLNADDPQIALESAARFQKLPHLQDATAQALVKSDQIKLKHALAVIALEHNFGSWAAFKHHLERKEQLVQRRQSYYTRLYPARCAGYMLEWHADYDVASLELGGNGGYLFPYKNQFFICQAEYIERLGLDPDDPDWERIAYNWVHPADQAAWQRLDDKLRAFEVQLQTGEQRTHDR